MAPLAHPLDLTPDPCQHFAPKMNKILYLLSLWSGVLTLSSVSETESACGWLGGRGFTTWIFSSGCSRASEVNPDIWADTAGGATYFSSLDNIKLFAIRHKKSREPHRICWLYKLNNYLFFRIRRNSVSNTAVVYKSFE